MANIDRIFGLYRCYLRGVLGSTSVPNWFQNGSKLVPPDDSLLVLLVPPSSQSPHRQTIYFGLD